MGTEILSIPEEYLQEIIRFIKAGTKKIPLSPDCREGLMDWCNEIETKLNAIIVATNADDYHDDPDQI